MFMEKNLHSKKAKRNLITMNSRNVPKWLKSLFQRLRFDFGRKITNKNVVVFCQKRKMSWNGDGILDFFKTRMKFDCLQNEVSRRDIFFAPRQFLNKSLQFFAMRHILIPQIKAFWTKIIHLSLPAFRITAREMMSIDNRAEKKPVRKCCYENKFFKLSFSTNL